MWTKAVHIMIIQMLHQVSDGDSGGNGQHFINVRESCKICRYSVWPTDFYFWRRNKIRVKPSAFPARSFRKLDSVELSKVWIFFKPVAFHEIWGGKGFKGPKYALAGIWKVFPSKFCPLSKLKYFFQRVPNQIWKVFPS